MDIKLLERYYIHKQFNEGLKIVLQKIEELKGIGKFSAVKHLLSQLKNEHSFYILIRYLDYGLLYQYSNFLARYASKKFPSIWTLSWNIETYLENGQALEIQKQFEQMMNRGELKRYSEAIQEKIQFSYIQVLLELKKYEQAESYLKNCQQEVNAKWGYYYLEKGDRQQAKEHFLKARNNYRSYMMLSMIEGMEGNPEKGLHFIEEGKTKFLDVPGLLLEEIYRYRDLGNVESMMHSIKKLEKISPDHFYRPYLLQLKADYYYQVGRIKELHSLLQHPVLKDSPYQHMKPMGERKILPLNPVIQKSNYCVPACLQMLMAYRGDTKHQDEIASYIFTGNGSTMPNTIAYWEKSGYECLYITADLATVKQCIQHDLPILLCVDIELASHVQIITGYDDRIGVVYIQDPNMADVLKITYEEYEKTYYMTSYLGIVGVKEYEKDTLSFLARDDNQYYRQLYTYSELLDEDAEKYMSNMLSFLQENAEHPHTSLYIIKHLHDEQAKDLFSDVVKRLECKGVEHDMVYLHMGEGFLAHGEVDRAESFVEKVKNKQQNGYYYFLKGRIYYEMDEYEAAIDFFQNALKQDYEHQLSWSYLSLCYGFNGELKKALEASYMAYNQDACDLFATMNHCKILFDNHLYEEALAVLRVHQEDFGQEAVFAYTMGKTVHALGHGTCAMDWLKLAIKYDKTIYYPYLLLADIVEFEKKNLQEAERYLLAGTLDAHEKSELYCRLGTLYMESKRYDEALSQFARCMEEYPTYSFAFLKHTEVLFELGKKQESKQQLLQLEQQFSEDVEFLINAGMSPLYQEHIDESLRLLEIGIPFVDHNWEEPLGEYCKILSTHSLWERGIAFFTSEVEKKGKLQHIFLTYKAMLLHEQGKQGWEEAFQQALAIKENVFTHLQYGEALFQEGQYDEAKQHFLYGLEHHGQDTRCLMRLAELAKQEEESEAERSYLKKIFEIDCLDLDGEYFFSLLTEEETKTYLTKLESNEQIMSQSTGLYFVSYAYRALGNVEKEKALVMKAQQLDKNKENQNIV